MPDPVFQKTGRGRAEIAQRSAGLSAATRSVLILVNGQDTVTALAARGLPDAREHLRTLLALGLIEVVAPPPPPPPPPTPPPAVAPPPPAPTVPELDALRRQVLARLEPHFGPDTGTVAQALRAARTAAEFNHALDGIESKLAIYMGRKQAARELQGLRPPP
jgi:hypothetical protein